MRHVCNYTWRVYYSCLVMGAWSCLVQDMNFKARHVFLRRRGGFNGTGAKDNGKEFFNDISNCFISVFNNIYF